MTREQRAAIQAFHASVESLRAAGVARSHRYLGDIAEFLCADKLQIDLAGNLR